MVCLLTHVYPLVPIFLVEKFANRLNPHGIETELSAALGIFQNIGYVHQIRVGITQKKLHQIAACSRKGQLCVSTKSVRR